MDYKWLKECAIGNLVTVTSVETGGDASGGGAVVIREGCSVGRFLKDSAPRYGVHKVGDQTRCYHPKE